MTNQEFYDKLCEAYDYRQPMKVLPYGVCPRCKGDSDCTTYDYITLYNFCAECGQALDWTDHPFNRGR